MYKVNIRKAMLDDFSTLQKLGKELMISDSRFDKHIQTDWYFNEEGKKLVKKWITGRRSVTFVAEVDGQIVGLLAGGIAKVAEWRPLKHAHLSILYIQEKYRNNNIGKKLLEKFIEWSRERKADSITLYTMAANSEAIEFYQRHGLKPLISTMELPLK